jgi:hypothetical protein
MSTDAPQQQAKKRKNEIFHAHLHRVVSRSQLSQLD